MGNVKSAPTRSASKGVILTLDALGTLYRFKEPVGAQYLRIARQAGFNDNTVSASDVDQAFRSAYKTHIKEYPNYGKGTLESPAKWWSVLVNRTFAQVSNNPPDVGMKLYDHFTSEAAYELFPDVKPFFQRLRHFRRSDGLALIVGVITNSDPRVRDVLRSLSIQVNGSRPLDTMMQNPLESLARFGDHAKDVVNRGRPVTPWHGAWDEKHDIDFVVTSYESSAGKPDSRIFRSARGYAGLTSFARTEQGQNDSISLANLPRTVSSMRENARLTEEMQWIHVGDDIHKDIRGAENSGLQALLIDREGKYATENVVSSLDDVATTISLLMQTATQVRQ